ncbi:acyl--CoA ligase [Aldersonia sp. NBC_00410]|uniref:class I adenylate-forming enzyme family protein n=1 Tax=Aldersonia sp. NBC_00410 TaxID=2975954 RepID=UPI0022509742|nr:class I adenylate-forming enzyme family protein [Aldersonia sp. NBC_00410]MCX5045401.1 acyl--CoA ligase [Aldersonia sp. NBC_00410]
MTTTGTEAAISSPNLGDQQHLSIISGPPLADEPGLGTLTLPGFLREVTTRFGDREALVAGDVRWTYADLWERSIEVARALRAAGIGKDGRVGVLMTNRLEWLSGFFGTALAGGVAVTLSTFSTKDELEYLIDVSAVSVLLFERRILKRDFAEVLTALEPQLETAAPGAIASAKYPFLRHVVAVDDTPGGAIEGWADFLARGSSESRELVEETAARTRPSDAAVLFFSSGSTSKPKGILSAHRGVSIQTWRFARIFALGPEDHVRCWTANGFFWSGNFGMAVGTTLAAGGAIVLQSGFDASAALELMQAERVNFLVAWPHQWAQLQGAPNWLDVDLSAMKYVDLNSPIAQHPTVSTTYTEPLQAYGNTETFTITSCFPANTPVDVHGNSSGVPLPGNTIRVVDPLSGEVVPLGERGEICVKGPTLMLGYLGTSLDETLDDEGFLHTGDGGYIDDVGRLVWEGRLTDIIKTGGANVSPVEVDEALETHPAVKLGRTVGVPHETLGELVVACIVPQDGIPVDASEIRAFLKERLASYKVPREVLFFDDSEMAQTGSAKVKSSDLRELAAKRLSE